MDSIKFTKEQLLNSKEFKNRKDVLMVLIAADEVISKEETVKRITKFMKGKVK